ncbi:GntR family transcriptional regulator [Solihabitans fulvus]|uniref:GntR family transcriptional regulator n=1 Tax=Solihabitans fulvus TaxID=1892852 RepID=A0A5B2WRD7_9PSEU|nr:GntR family transcriptional regulator [Solihabitans fulvus]KAA2253370.1 GntR family transcriptional regulator [Solihabitans fulvus]
MTAQPLHLSLAGQTVDLVRELVLTGEIPPGERVNEVELASRLGISRGPLREAIRHLASEGLLVLVPNRGAHVPKADADEVRALFELRIALECAAASLAAQRRTGAELARLREVSAESRANYQAGRRFPHRLDLAFHQALLDAARSPRIAEQVRLVQQRVILLRSRLNTDSAHQFASMDDHDELIAAVAAADAALAGAVMRRHLDRVRDQLLGEIAPS